MAVSAGLPPSTSSSNKSSSSSSKSKLSSKEAPLPPRSTISSNDVEDIVIPRKKKSSASIVSGGLFLGGVEDAAGGGPPLLRPLEDAAAAVPPAVRGPAPSSPAASSSLSPASLARRASSSTQAMVSSLWSLGSEVTRSFSSSLGSSPSGPRRGAPGGASSSTAGLIPISPTRVPHPSPLRRRSSNFSAGYDDMEELELVVAVSPDFLHDGDADSFNKPGGLDDGIENAPESDSQDDAVAVVSDDPGAAPERSGQEIHPIHPSAVSNEDFSEFVAPTQMLTAGVLVPSLVSSDRDLPSSPSPDNILRSKSYPRSPALSGAGLSSSPDPSQPLRRLSGGSGVLRPRRHSFGRGKTWEDEQSARRDHSKQSSRRGSLDLEHDSSSTKKSSRRGSLTIPACFEQNPVPTPLLPPTPSREDRVNTADIESFLEQQLSDEHRMVGRGPDERQLLSDEHRMVGPRGPVPPDVVPDGGGSQLSEVILRLRSEHPNISPKDLVRKLQESYGIATNVHAVKRALKQGQAAGFTQQLAPRAEPDFVLPDVLVPDPVAFGQHLLRHHEVLPRLSGGAEHRPIGGEEPTWIEERAAPAVGSIQDPADLRSRTCFGVSLRRSDSKSHVDLIEANEDEFADKLKALRTRFERGDGVRPVLSGGVSVAGYIKRHTTPPVFLPGAAGAGGRVSGGGGISGDGGGEGGVSLSGGVSAPAIVSPPRARNRLAERYLERIQGAKG